VSDPLFGISLLRTLKLKRTIEMYQWVEHQQSNSETQLGGKKVTTTTYTYQKEWRPIVVNSGSFKRSYEHPNPTQMRFPPLEVVANPIHLGAFTLPPTVTNLVNWYEPQSVSANNIPNNQLRLEAQEENSSTFYFGSHPPNVGDTRVTFSSVPEQTATLVARQAGQSFTAYQAKFGGTILMIQPGEHDVLEMFESYEKGLKCQTNCFRLLGVVMLFIGFSLTMNFIPTITSLLPILENITGGLISLIAFLLALIVGVVVILFSWVYQRCFIHCCSGSSMKDLYEQNPSNTQGYLNMADTTIVNDGKGDHLSYQSFEPPMVHAQVV
jgi:hypothetical protein